MKNSQETMNHFYQNVGKLFFAVAAVDKHIEEKEIKSLKEHVTNNWLALEDTTDYFGSDAAHQIEIVFDWLAEEIELPDSETCYSDFASFRKKHDSLFTPQVKSLIRQTCDDIATAFNGKNKSELVLLSRIDQLLDKK